MAKYNSETLKELAGKTYCYIFKGSTRAYLNGGYSRIKFKITAEGLIDIGDDKKYSLSEGLKALAAKFHYSRFSAKQFGRVWFDEETSLARDLEYLRKKKHVPNRRTHIPRIYILSCRESV